MSGWAGIGAVIVGDVTTEVATDDVRIVEVVLKVVVDIAEAVEPHATRVVVAAKSVPAVRIARLIARLAPPSIPTPGNTSVALSQGRIWPFDCPETGQSRGAGKFVRARKTFWQKT